MINGLSAGVPVDYRALSEKVIEYRRDLHQIPELGFLVYKTGAYVKEKLSAFDCELSDIVTTGILAFFDFGCESTIIFRADMDALPIEEATGLPYASKNPGCMHACGHDGHMAGLIGFAEILDRYKKEGYKAGYNALLLFQPAEETIDGALRICGTHIFDRYNVKAIFGLHLWPMMAKGEIASRPGPMMARSTAVNVTFEGVSAHCGEPQKGRDALAAACRFVSDIYSYKEHHVRERSVLKFGRMESGNVRNAISPFARLEGTMRTFYDNTWEHLVFAMKKLASEIEEAFGVKVSIDVSKSHPAVVNDEKLYADAKPALMDLNYVELRRPVLIAEDFSFFEQQLPGVFFFIAEDFSFFEQQLPGVFFFVGTGSGIPLHSDDYDFDDSVIIEGVKLFNALFTELP